LGQVKNKNNIILSNFFLFFIFNFIFIIILYTLFYKGLVITKKSKYPDELFEFFEILIDEKYPVYSGINPSVTVNINNLF